MTTRLLAVLAMGAMATGCASFNEHMIRPPSLSNATKSPAVVAMAVGKFDQQLNGEGANRGIMSNQTVANGTLKVILNNWKDKELIADWGPPGELKTPPTHTLTISGVRNEDSSILGAVFTGLTLYLLPSSSTVTTDANFDLLNHRTGKHYTSKAKSGFTITQWLFFLPATPFSWLAIRESFTDAGALIYADFDKQGAFK